MSDGDKSKKLGDDYFWLYASPENVWISGHSCERHHIPSMDPAHKRNAISMTERDIEFVNRTWEDKDVVSGLIYLLNGK